VDSARANKKSSDISVLIGQIPVFLKSLWAFAMVAVFPYAVEESELIWYCETVLPGFAFNHFEPS
jgi:hypothetical protein